MTAPERIRLFVALELPAAAREELAGWTRDVLRDDDSLRLVDAAALHVTLAFLGWRPAREVEEIAATTAAAAKGLAGPLLRPTSLAGLPQRRPRVLALDLADDGGRASTVQGAVSRALAAAGFHRREQRRFRPHVTVARVRGGGRAPGGRFPDPPPISIRAGGVALYRSDLAASGARYTVLARTPLGDAVT